MTGSTLWFIVATISFVLATAIYLVNAPHREAVDKAIASPIEGAKELGFFDLCGGVQSGDDLNKRDFRTPERLACYDRSYLLKFADRASQNKTSFGDRALDRYLSPVLLWNDVAFAIVMATAVTALGAGLFLILGGTMKWLAAASACLGLIYGVTDVCEDVLLARILRDPQAADQRTIALAGWMTRVKLVSLTASVGGAVAFVAMAKARDLSKS